MYRGDREILEEMSDKVECPLTKGSSVNDGIADSEAFISYNMFECTVEDLISSGPSSL